MRTTTTNLIFLLGEKIASACARVCEREGREIEDRHTDREERKGGAVYAIDAMIYIYIFNISNKYVRVQNSFYILSGL